MANTFKRYLDKPMWDYVAPAPNAHAAGGAICGDLRTRGYGNPFLYYLASASVLNAYSKIQKSWFPTIVNPGLGGTFGAGTGIVYAPAHAIMGTVASGSTTTAINLSACTVAGSAISALPPNVLANAGDGLGYIVRVIGSGKTEERRIIGNTASATPTLYVSPALTFTPASGDRVEILSGRVFMLNAGTLGSTSFRSYEVGTQTLSSLGNTNLPSTVGTDFAAVALDEQYTPYNHLPGEGFVKGTATYDTSGTTKGCLQATAAASGTITGQSSGGDASVVANEYRNFQIRIVEDTTTPAAVGQRRIIASHTAGPSPVYTLGTSWTTTPSSSAKFVIEYPNLLLVQSSAVASWYAYNYTDATINNGTNSINANSWSTTYFAAPANAHGAGVILLQTFGIQPDSAKLARHSYIYRFRGGGASTLDLFDIAGGTTGAWTAGITYRGNTPAFTTGSCGKYAPGCCEGMFGYINFYTASAINQIFRFDVKNRILLPVVATEWIQSGTAAVGDRIATYNFADGSDIYSVVFLLSHLSTVNMELLVQA